MPAFSNSITIEAPAHLLFALTQDYSRRLEWDPFLKKAELVGNATKPEVGVRAWCVSTFGSGMETEYVSFDPPEGCAIKMTAGPKWIGEFAGSWRFREGPNGNTEVTFRYRLVGRPQILTPLLKRVFEHDMRKRLHSLKKAVEVDEILESTNHKNIS